MTRNAGVNIRLVFFLAILPIALGSIAQVHTAAAGLPENLKDPPAPPSGDGKLFGEEQRQVSASDTVLVSTRRHAPEHGSLFVDAFEWSQKFTVAADCEYELSSVTVRLVDRDLRNALMLAIREAGLDGTEPENRDLISLSGPAYRSTDEQVFTAQRGATLEKGKSYFLFMTGTAELETAGPGIEGLPGWTVEDHALRKSPRGAWENASDAPLHMVVIGRPTICS